MERATIQRFCERLRSDGGAAGIRTDAADTGVLRVPAAAYSDPARCERERAVLFRQPRIVAVAASLTPGTCVPLEHAVVTRDHDGTVRAFANACRHRGTRLVDAPCTVKAFVCPYHAWTYDLTGKLVHVPHAESFAGVDLSARNLVALPVVERYGLIWLGPEAGTDDGGERVRELADRLDAYLGAIAPDVAALQCERHVMFKRAQTTRRCNWKLVIDAFLDGYHIRVLHRDSVYRYFLDAASVAEPAGAHVRALTGRRALLDAPTELAPVDLRQLATPSLLLFPSTVVVEHPDFLSIMTVTPRAADLTEWDHMMLIPAERAGEVDHWTRSWELIEEGVFQREDLWVCEQAQRSIAAGAVDELLFGSLELPAKWFHASIADALERAEAV